MLTDLLLCSQINDKTSTLAFYRTLTKLRKTYPDIFIYGSYECLDEANPNTHTFVKRALGDKKGEAVIVLNFTKDEQTVASDVEEKVKGMEQVLNSEATSGNKSAATAGSKATLAPYEARIYVSTA